MPMLTKHETNLIITNHLVYEAQVNTKE